jgi:ABC-type transport system involved in multi-copper enzyme maturation permease subunit
MSEPWSSDVLFTLRRLRLIAGHTLRETLRLRLTLLLAAVGGLLLAGSTGLREYGLGSAELKLIGDFGLGVISLFGTLLATLVTTQLYFSDLLDGTAACLLTRSVRRGEYLIGKFLAVAAFLALFIATLVGVLAVLLWWRGHQLGVAVVGLPVIFSAGAVLWMKLTLVAALTLFVCSYATTAIFAVCAGLLLVVIGHLRPFASGRGLAWLRLWPNLALFDPEALLASGQAPVGLALASLVAYWAGYLLLFGVLSVQVFQRREF